MRHRSAQAPRSSEATTQLGFHHHPLDRRRPQEPIGYHVTLRLEDDRPIATTKAARRLLARVVLTQGKQRGLLAFGVADDHLHAELATDRASAGAFALYVETALRWQLGLGARFDRARIRPLYDQRHAYNTFHYAHRQDSRHELALDHAREGTSLPDLLGLRVLDPSLIARVRTHLPRIRRGDLVERFSPGVFERSPSGAIRLEVLAEAAAAALALPDLRGRSVDVWRARRAAVHAAGPEVPSRLLGDCLGFGVRAVQAVRTLPGEPALIRAVEKQAILQAALASESGGPG